MLVRINNTKAVDMLLERLRFWSDDEIIHNLYEIMYKNYINSGVFDDCEFDVVAIVDNDYINFCDVIAEGVEAYEDIKELYEACGTTDISCEYEKNHGYSFIEAEYKGSFLCRW